MDIDTLSTDQLEQELSRLEVLRRRVTALQLNLIAEADRRQVPLGDGCSSTSEWVSARMDVPSDEAKRLARLSKRLDDLPLMAKRLSEGEIGIMRAELLARVATADDEGEWAFRLSGYNLGAAEKLVSRHRRVTRKHERSKHRDSYLFLQPSLDESWWKIAGGVGAVAGKTISETLARKADELPDRNGSLVHRQALALEAMCIDDGGEAGSGGGATITAYLDLDLANGTGGQTGAEMAAGPRIGPDAIRELLCNGAVQIVGLSDGKPVTTTHRTNYIPPSIREFVLWRDQHHCRAPGCTSQRRLQPHHIVFDSHGGPPEPFNLVTLCWYHHHVVVHRRGMRIEKKHDGSIRFVLPADSRDPP